MKKRFIAGLVLVFMVLGVFAGCGDAETLTEIEESLTASTAKVTTAAATTTTKAITTTITTTTKAPEPEMKLPLTFSTNTVSGDLYIDNDGVVRSISDNHEWVVKDVKSIYYLRSGGWSDYTVFYIKNDNTLRGFGQGELLGDDTNIDKDLSENVKILDNVAMLQIHDYGTIYALDRDKNLYGWGYSNLNAFGQSDYKSFDRYSYSPQLILRDVISCSENSAVQSNGDAWVWGFPLQELGSANQSTWTPIKIAEKASKAVQDGLRRFTYLGSVLIRHGGLLETIVYDDDEITPLYVEKSIQDMVSYENAFFFINWNHELYARGNNGKGILGDGSKVDRDKFVKISDDVKAVYPYAYITTNNELWIWDDDNPKPRKLSDDVVWYSYLVVAPDSYDRYDYQYGLKSDGTLIDLEGNIVATNVMLPTTETIE
jgi:hypothetical protein